MKSVEAIVQEDCEILLKRAVLGKTITGFGEDGLGKFGRHPMPRDFVVQNLIVTVSMDGNGKFDGTLLLHLSDYDSRSLGLLCTDQNFMIGLRRILSEQCIDRNCLTWASESRQGNDFTTFEIDVPALLDWA